MIEGGGRTRRGQVEGRSIQKESGAHHPIEPCQQTKAEKRARNERGSKSDITLEGSNVVRQKKS